MAKRFTDSDKWKKPFIRGLEGAYKLLWLYILDDCDHAGMWQVDIDVAEVKTGEDLDLKIAEKLFAEKIQIFDNGEKWFIQDFIDFQYGELNPENRAHRSVLNLLGRYQNKGLGRGLQRAKDKDKDKEQDMVKVKYKEQDPEISIEIRRENFYQEVGLKYSEKYQKDMLLAFCDYWTEYNEGGIKMKFEMQKVFNTAMRLSTWHSNNNKFKNNGTSTKSTITADGIINEFKKRTQSNDVDSSTGR